MEHAVRASRPLRPVLDILGAAVLLMVFAGFGDPDILFHVVWVILTAEAFLYGIRVSLPRIVLAVGAVIIYSMLPVAAESPGSDLTRDTLLFSEWPLMVAIILMVAVMADRHLITSRRYAGLYRRAADQLITAQEDERTRLARDLHDGVGQSVTAVGLTLDAVARALATDAPEGRERARVLVDTARELSTAALDETRDVAGRLRPARLHERGLAAAVEDLAATAGTPVSVTIAVDARVLGLLDVDREVEAYRIIQEALANASRHAHASTIRIRLDVERAVMVAEVSDDGLGFIVRDRDHQSLGIPGMRERAGAIGAQLRIRSRPGAGTMIRLAVPLAHAGDTAAPTRSGGLAPRQPGTTAPADPARA